MKKKGENRERERERERERKKERKKESDDRGSDDSEKSALSSVSILQISRGLGAAPP